MVKLMANNGEIIEVDFKSISKSCLIKNLVEDCGNSDDIIPLVVEPSILKEIIEWCDNHIDDPNRDDNLIEKKNEIKLTKWDEEFVEKNKERIGKLLMSSNFLDIKQLIEILSLSVANKIINKTPEEVKVIIDNLSE